MAISDRGFASMAPDKQRAIASKGGKASGGNFANDRQKASEAGKKGAAALSAPGPLGCEQSRQSFCDALCVRDGHLFDDRIREGPADMLLRNSDISLAYHVRRNAPC